MITSDMMQYFTLQSEILSPVYRLDNKAFSNSMTRKKAKFQASKTVLFPIQVKQPSS